MKEPYTDLCKACYIRIMKPSKKKIKKEDIQKSEAGD